MVKIIDLPDILLQGGQLFKKPGETLRFKVGGGKLQRMTQTFDGNTQMVQRVRVVALGCVGQVAGFFEQVLEAWPQVFCKRPGGCLACILAWRPGGILLQVLGHLEHEPGMIRRLQVVLNRLAGLLTLLFDLCPKVRQ